MAAEESERVPQIDTIIILDRQIDLISPLISSRRAVFPYPWKVAN